MQSATESLHENKSRTTAPSCRGEAFQAPLPPLRLANESGAKLDHFALAARATNDALRDWNVSTGELRWPQGLTSLLGYTPSVITNETGFWQRHLHPDDRSRIAASMRDALAPHAGEHWSGEYRFRKADGSYLLLLERAAILRDEAGNARRWVGSLMDITARKELQDQLCRSQRMEAFGQLAAGVAHDFNNYFTAILGYSDLVLSDQTLKRSSAKHAGEIRQAASRASALAAQLLAFSRKHPLAPRPLDLNALLTNLERSLLRLVGEDVTIECHLQREKEGMHISADREQMTQIILNLALNAREAMPNGGRLCLTTETVSFNGDAPESLAPGEYVALHVRDNGVGMPPEVQARVFEPFFTTKSECQGSGLGLATSYGIARQSGGDIQLESEPALGTTVTVYLPRIPAPSAKYRKQPQLPGGSETILLVEDDIGVRHLALRVLRHLGYDVIEAASGNDAQRLVEAEPKRKIDLLLTDVVMPQMSGRDFAEWLRQRRPKTKVVFISGYLDETEGEEAEKQQMFFLPKPFDPAQLAGRIRQVLDLPS